MENSNADFDSSFEKGQALWQIRHKFLFVMELIFLRVYFFFSCAVGVIVISILLDVYELIAVIIISIMAMGHLKLLNTVTFLDRIPIINHSLKIVRKLYIFYFANKPPMFLFYIFYVPLSFISCFFSKRAREELKLYIQLILTIAIFFIIKTAVYYFKVFPPYLDMEDALMFIFVQIFMTTFFVLFLVPPLLSTSFVLYLTGYRKTLKVLNFFYALVFIFFMGFLFEVLNDDYSPTFLSQQVLIMRFEKEDFREDLLSQTKEFFAQSTFSQGIADSVFVNEKGTKEYREKISRLLSGTEKKAFSIIDVVDGDSVNWLFVRYQEPERCYFLYAMNQNKDIYTNYDKLSEIVKTMFVTSDREISISSPRKISKFALIDDNLFKRK